MGRPPKAPAAPDDAPIADASQKMVLKKSAGFITDGKQNHFFPAGTEFEPECDSEIIAFLIRAGAIFE